MTVQMQPLEPLPAALLERLADNARRVQTRPGEVVSAFGDPLVALVIRGWYKLVRFDASGEQQFIALRRRERTIGFEASVGARIEAPEVVSLIEGELLTWPLEVFAELIRSEAALAARVAAILAEQADEDFRFRHQVQTTGLLPRLANLLYTLAAEEGERHPNGYRVSMPFSQRELADLLEVRRETVSVKVCQLETEGLIERLGRELVVNARQVRQYLASTAAQMDPLGLTRPEPDLVFNPPVAPESRTTRPRTGWLLERMTRPGRPEQRSGLSNVPA